MRPFLIATVLALTISAPCRGANPYTWYWEGRETAVLAALKAHGPMRPPLIALRTGMKAETVAHALRRLAGKGKVERADGGPLTNTVLYATQGVYTFRAVP